MIRSGARKIKVCFAVDSHPAKRGNRCPRFEPLKGLAKTGHLPKIDALAGLRSRASFLVIFLALTEQFLNPARRCKTNYGFEPLEKSPR